MAGVSVNGDSAPAPVPFSYAQAAKGQTPHTAAPAASPAAAKETANWTDDASDAHTAIEDHQSNGPLNGAQTKQSTTPKAAANPPFSELASSASYPSSPHYDSSATTAKEDDVNSPTKTSSDSIWDLKPPLSQSVESTSDAVKDGDVGTDAAKDSERDQSALKPMKEAPVPAVNFWQKRAQEAKAKQNPTVSTPSAPQNDKDTRQITRQTSQTAKPEPDTAQPTEEKNQEHLNGAPPQPHDSSLVAGKAKGAKSGRPQKSESTLSKPAVAPPPPTRDASAWPTPLTAQDENRRKALEKEDKADKDKPQPTTSKPHGKNEWVHVPYTPSVKFNTPLPQTRGRGGRGGGRGGRGGSSSERGAFSSGAATAKEDNGSETRGAAGHDGRRSSMQAPNGSRSTSFNATDKSAPLSAVNKRYSLQDEAVSSLSSRPNQTGQRQMRPTAEKSNSTSGTAAAPSSAKADDSSLKPKPSPDPQLSERGRSTSSVTESALDGTQQTQSKRRSPRSTDAQDTFSPDGQSASRALSEHGTATAKPPRTDSRPSVPGGRSFDSQREAWGNLPFRDGRADRGRGRGGRGNYYTLSHHTSAQSQQPNANVTPIQTNGPYSAKSSTAFQPQYFNQANQPPPAPADRRSFPSGPRSASIPGDVSFARFGPAYTGNQPLAMYSPYINPAFDYGAAPMAALPYTPSIDQSMVINGVAFQLNYYFSLENLLKDVYLRKHMDSQGFVSLNFIANFQRMKDLTTDLELIKFACSQLPEFDLQYGADGQMRIRKREGWDKWVLSMEERDPSAQNDGPSPSEDPKLHTPLGFEAPRSPFPDMSGHGGIDGNMAAFGMTPSFQPVAVATPIDGTRSPQEMSGEQALPTHGNNVLGSQYASPEIAANGVGDYAHEDDDSFPNARIPFLTVAVRPYSSASRPSVRSESSRTFSNGSISMEELKQSEDSQSATQSQPDEPAEGSESQKAPNNSKPQSSPSSTPNESAVEPVELFWFKGQESRQPLPSNGNAELYVQLHFKALEERQHAEPGSCPHDLDVLYQFWSHFLIRNFNTTMYNEFRQLAHDDTAQGLSNVGMRSLITFYSEALSSQQPIRDRVARHYVSLVKNEDKAKDRPAFEQLRSAWRNGALNMKNRKRISTYVDQELRDELDKVDR